jgi:hypothetical protein
MPLDEKKTRVESRNPKKRKEKQNPPLLGSLDEKKGMNK